MDEALRRLVAGKLAGGGETAELRSAWTGEMRPSLR